MCLRFCDESQNLTRTSYLKLRGTWRGRRVPVSRIRELAGIASTIREESSHAMPTPVIANGSGLASTLLAEVRRFSRR